MAINERQHPHGRRRTDVFHGKIVRAYLVLVGVAIAAVGLLQMQLDHAQSRQHAGLVAGCERLNILEVKENASHLADWRVFRIVEIETRSAPKASNPKVATDRARFLVPIDAAVRSKVWTPLVDCSRAVRQHGGQYVLPQPIPFDVRLPPRSALVLP